MKKTNLIALLLLTSCSVFSQILGHFEYEEKPDDPYILKARNSYQTSPAYHYKTALVETYQVNVNENGENMIGDAANEPSIAINPNNPNQMVIGWRQFSSIGHTATSSFN